MAWRRSPSYSGIAARMTRRYAKIADRTVAAEYFAVTDQVEPSTAKGKQHRAAVFDRLRAGTQQQRGVMINLGADHWHNADERAGSTRAVMTSHSQPLDPDSLPGADDSGR
jgi:hypothetical protein